MHKIQFRSSFNGTILNVFRNYVPSKYTTVDEKDLVWMNENIKSKIKTKKILYKQYIKNGDLKVILCFLKHL